MIRSVKIGSHFLLGIKNVIMPEVELDDFCVVAASSFVNQSLKPYSVIGGNPTNLIKKLK